MPLLVSLDVMEHGNSLLFWNSDRVEMQQSVVCCHEEYPSWLVFVIYWGDVYDRSTFGQENNIACSMNLLAKIVIEPSKYKSATESNLKRQALSAQQCVQSVAFWASEAEYVS